MMVIILSGLLCGGCYALGRVHGEIRAARSYRSIFSAGRLSERLDNSKEPVTLYRASFPRGFRQ